MNNKNTYLGVSKPKKKPQIHNVKTSDRRLAAGRQPAQFLHSSSTTDNKPISSATIARTSKILLDLKNKQRQSTPQSVSGDGTITTVKRQVGGKKWEDSTLLEWDPSHFRIFVGNLGQDVTDEILFRAFMKYPSLSKVKVVMDHKLQTSKGFGFVAFEDSQDYLRALNDMNGKYVGQRPVQLKRAKTEIKPVVKKNKK